MYEFKYPKVAQMSAQQIQDTIEYLADSVISKMNESEKAMSILDLLTYQYTANHIRSGVNVSINMETLDNSEIDYAIIDKLISDSKQIKLPLRIYISGSSKFGNETSSVQMLFSQEAIDKLVDLHNYLVDRDEDGLYFMEDASTPENSWSFEEVITANSEIDSIVDYINEQKFTPFEAASFIHQYVTTQFSYRENDDDPMMARSLIGVLNSDDIVCVGYSTLTKAIIDKLNMPGLECTTFKSKITPSRDSSVIEGIDLNAPFTGHMQNLIKIDDKSYGVSGVYVSDACWDSKNEGYPNGKGIANFMYPVEDLLHYKGMGFDQFHSKVDNMFKMMGLGNRKLDPYSLPIISENINNSKPISIDSYKQCLFNMFKKMSPNEKDSDIQERVDSIMRRTAVTSYIVFNKEAIGAIAKYANETIKELEDKELKELDIKDLEDLGIISEEPEKGME